MKANECYDPLCSKHAGKLAAVQNTPSEAAKQAAVVCGGDHRGPKPDLMGRAQIIQAAIDQICAERDKELLRLTGICERLEKCVAEGATKDEIANLTRDKERLDWLNTCQRVEWHKQEVPIVISTPGVYPLKTDIRQAIDAARRGEG